MYNQQQTKYLQEQTQRFIKQAAIKKEDIESLKAVLRFHEYRYYVQNDTLIGDTEYDMLFKQLEKLEKEDATLITADSPTQRVGAGLIKDFPKTLHLVPMLSL